ncbi:phage tail tape measure protein [Antarcticirhabdus aurantiaca]|uniref:Phage tail tape measure protein n=1 Tax=Antarcticirhabdus aurantiaca TaxID=2606717 RepID=A0ACD4NIL5_9HYPH|nr:phage tail tape measure protein [Antarcticirhabdus aurantiaca]WAJ26695.1 phage tail tape measure protein [Jeongeuplla avenae]
MEADETYRVAFDVDTSALDRALGDLAARSDRFGAALGSALKGAVAGGRSLDTVLATLGTRLTGIALDAALRPLEGLVSGGIGQLFAGLGGLLPGAAASPGIVPFAKGGVIGTPTFFPMGGRIGLMGEAGAEAVLPLKRGADGTLGVGVPGGARGGGGTVVMNVSTPDAASFRRSGAQIEAMLARATLRGRRGL